MSAIIRIVGLADGSEFSRQMWLESYDVDMPPSTAASSYFLDDGTAVINGFYGGKILLTPSKARAMRFATTAEAMLAWNTQSIRQPRRPDGRPNKPLTALTVEVQSE